MSQMPED